MTQQSFENNFVLRAEKLRIQERNTWHSYVPLANSQTCLAFQKCVTYDDNIVQLIIMGQHIRKVEEAWKSKVIVL